MIRAIAAITHATCHMPLTFQLAEAEWHIAAAATAVEPYNTHCRIAEGRFSRHCIIASAVKAR